MNRLNKKKQNTKEQYTEDVLAELEKDLQKFHLTVQKKDRAIQKYVRFLKLTKTEYQKLFEESKKQKINTVERERQIKKEKIIKKDNIK